MICTVCKKVHAHIGGFTCCPACRRNSRTWKSRHWEQNLLVSHRNRDMRAGLYDEDNFCTLDHIKTVRRELNDKCYHCHVEMDAENRSQPDGMTLQRLDNRIGHTCPNTTLACLSCNRHRVESCDTGWLQRRLSQVYLDKLIDDGYQLLTNRRSAFA